MWSDRVLKKKLRVRRRRSATVNTVMTEYSQPLNVGYISA